MDRRKFTKKFKLEVVQAYLQRAPSETQADIGKRYQIGKSQMSSWIGLYGGQVTRGVLRPTAATKSRPLPPSAAGKVTLGALANVINAIEPLGRDDRRTVIEAVLGLLPP
jgi:transposase-like protein